MKNREREFLYETRKLVAAQGFNEVYNYSFLSEEAVAALWVRFVRTRQGAESDCCGSGADAQVACTRYLEEYRR